MKVGWKQNEKKMERKVEEEISEKKKRKKMEKRWKERKIKNDFFEKGNKRELVEGRNDGKIRRGSYGTR